MPSKKQSSKQSSKPNPVDAHVGQRIRLLRISRGMRQQDLADAVGVKFQQLQKYETGSNRVSASRLVMLAKALDVRIADLFGKFAGQSDAVALDFNLQSRAVSNLVRNIAALDADARRRVADLVALIPVKKQSRRR